MASEWKKLAFFDEVATTFLLLGDTPEAYTTPGAYYKVNAGGNGVEEGLVAAAASGLATLDAGGLVAQDPKLHASKHENGGDDEISIADLAGEPAELATHKAVKAADAVLGHVMVEDASKIDVDGDGKLTLGAHAADHKSGGSDVIKLNELGAPTASVALNSQKITGLATPAAAGDGATKGYVDGVATGLDIKASCRVATAAVLPACTPAGSGVGKTLTMDAVGVLTIDGVATVLNDRILVKNQVVGEDNGIYKVTTEGEVGVAAVLTRATDFDEDAEVTAGAYSFIEEGTTLADQGWVLTTDNPITVDTTTLVFGQFSSAGGTPAHASTHQDGGSDEISIAGLSGEPAELTTHKAVKSADATLGHVIVEDASKIDVDGDGKLTLGAHAADHQNGGDDEISVAGLSGELADDQPPKTHATSHKSAGADVIKLNEFGDPTAKIPFAGQEGGDFCLENLAADPVPVLGKVYFKTGDAHPYVCTAIE